MKTDKSFHELASIIFLGGVFLPSQSEQIFRDSRGVVQNAADALQKGFLHGFSEHLGNKIQLVNLPFIGSYPRLYASVYFPACKDRLAEDIVVHGQGFLNIRILRSWSRFAAAFRGLNDAIKDNELPIVVVYSAHLPFLTAARLLRLFHRDVFLCVVVPDMPEFMGVGGWFYSSYKSVETYLFRHIVKRFDSFIFLTDAMGDRLGIEPNKSVVVEGIFDLREDLIQPETEITANNKFIILYTGTLSSRYGILDLLEAFQELEQTDACLWICGDGDTRNLIENLAKSNQRIKYFGQVRRSKALALQRIATVLVNPRRPEGEYTKYSFPSKTMEYLASGKQVIMHSLPGIPPEYLEHLIVPESPDAAGLVKALRNVYALRKDELEKRGDKARSFIFSKKSPYAQVGRVLEHIAHLKREQMAKT